MGPIVSRGILLDIVRLHGTAPADGAAITLDDLQRAAAAVGVQPEQGDIVLIRTGWQERTKPGVSFNEEPGINLEAGLWLAEAGVAIVGADNFAVEQLPFPEGTVFPVHQRLIRDFGIPLLEGLVLRPLADALAQAGRGEFLFAAAPLPVVGGTGSPIAPIAVL
jgi:kynurenine formamidase